MCPRSIHVPKEFIYYHIFQTSLKTKIHDLEMEFQHQKEALNEQIGTIRSKSEGTEVSSIIKLSFWMKLGFKATFDIVCVTML